MRMIYTCNNSKLCGITLDKNIIFVLKDKTIKSKECNLDNYPKI